MIALVEPVRGSNLYISSITINHIKINIIVSSYKVTLVSLQSQVILCQTVNPQGSLDGTNTTLYPRSGDREKIASNPKETV